MAERRFIAAGRPGCKAGNELTGAELAAVAHSLMIIGAPGIGKTHFLQDLAEQAPDRFCFLSVRSFINGSKVRPDRVLLLDGLDECAGSPDRALDDLCRRVNEDGQPAFWLSCRQASWNGKAFLPILHGCCDRIGVYQMLPLDRQGRKRLVAQKRGEAADMAILENLQQQFGDQVAGNPLLLEMACEAHAQQDGKGGTGDVYGKFVSRCLEECNPTVKQGQAAVARQKRMETAGRMMLVLLAAGKRGFRLPGGAGGCDDLLAVEDAVADGQLQAAMHILDTGLFCRSEDALVPVHLSVAEYMAGCHLAKHVEGGRTGRRLAACNVCGVDVESGRPPAPGREGLFAWFVAGCESGRREMLGIDPHGYVSAVGAWNLGLTEYGILLQEMAKSHKLHLWWGRDLWQRMRTNQAGIGGLFRLQLRQAAGESTGRIKGIVLDVLSDTSHDFPELMPAVAGLLADHEEGRAVRSRALRCLVSYSAHSMVARALRRIDERKADAGGSAWFRSMYIDCVLDALDRNGEKPGRRIIVNFFGGRCATDHFPRWHALVEHARRQPALARFALAWLQRRGRMQLAAEPESGGSSVLAHLAASALDENSDSGELLQLLLTPVGKTIAGQQAFRERLADLPALKAELFGRALAIWGTERLAPDERLVIELLDIGGNDARQIVAALENALAASSSCPGFRQAVGNLLCFLHRNDRKLEREVRAAAGRSELADLIADCRQGRLLEAARTQLQDMRSCRSRLELHSREPGLVDQVVRNPALVAGFGPKQLSYLRMKMGNDDLRWKLEPARPFYLEKCREYLGLECPGIARISDDYARGARYYGQGPFLDGMSDLFASDRDGFARLPDRVLGIGIVFATASIRRRAEPLPAWLQHSAEDGKRRPLIEGLVVGLAAKALRHKDALMVGEWLDCYATLFGGRLHLALLGRAGKSVSPLGVAGVLDGALRIAGIKSGLSGIIAAKRDRQGFAGWPSACCWDLAAWLLDGGEDNADQLLKLEEDRKALELVLKAASWLDRDRLSAMQKAFLLELALVYFGDRDFYAGFLAGMDATVAELIFDSLRDLNDNADWQTHDALEWLSGRPRFAGFSDSVQSQVKAIMARSLPQRLGRDFPSPDAATVCEFLDDGRPAWMH